MPPRPKYTALTDTLYEYMAAHRSPDDAVVRELRDETAALGDSSVMQIAPDQATFLRILVAAIGARRAIEVGTFTGYSALAIARGLAPDGRLLCMDVSEEWTSIARRYWEKAGVSDHTGTSSKRSSTFPLLSPNESRGTPARSSSVK